jgi:hypothetical protein
VEEGSRLRERLNCNLVAGSALNAVVDNLHETAESFHRQHMALLSYHLVNSIDYVENGDLIIERNSWPLKKLAHPVYLASMRVLKFQSALPESSKQGRSAEFARRLEAL